MPLSTVQTPSFLLILPKPHPPATYLDTPSPAIILGGFRIHVKAPSHTCSLSVGILFCSCLSFHSTPATHSQRQPGSGHHPKPRQAELCLPAHPKKATQRLAGTPHSSPFSPSFESMDHDFNGSHKHPLTRRLLTLLGKKSTQRGPNYPPSLNPDR